MFHHVTVGDAVLSGGYGKEIQLGLDLPWQARDASQAIDAAITAYPFGIEVDLTHGAFSSSVPSKEEEDRCVDGGGDVDSGVRLLTNDEEHADV